MSDDGLPAGNLELWTYRREDLEPTRAHLDRMLVEHRKRIGVLRRDEEVQDATA